MTEGGRLERLRQQGILWGFSFVCFVSTCITLWAQTFHGLMDGLALICVPELGRDIHMVSRRRLLLRI